MKDEKLELVKNKIDDPSKFANYEKYLDDIRKIDYFYPRKFKKEIIKFPFIYTVFRNFRRNFSILYWVMIVKIFKKMNFNVSKLQWKPMQVIMNINLKWRVKLFDSQDITKLLKKIIEEFVLYSKNNIYNPGFCFSPSER